MNQGTLDLHAPAPEHQVLRVYSGLYRRHTIVVSVIGKKNPASSGTEARVDGFRVGATTIEDNHPAVRYNTWHGGTLAPAYGGSLRAAVQRRTLQSALTSAGRSSPGSWRAVHGVGWRRYTP